MITRLYQLKVLALVYGAKFISMIFGQKKYWVICERGSDARDNGYCFYRYMKERHPEIKVYYIIDKKSSDYFKVQEDAVQYGSVKNFWVVANAEKIISSHYASVLPCMTTRLFAALRLSSKYYFLQHGIIKEKLESLFRKNAKVQLFVCGAVPEYAYVKENFGHPPEVVQYTGLARYDQLTRVDGNRKILIMPTWRSYIKTEEEFLKSEYYHKWSSFLNNAKLHACLQASGFQVLFYPHFEFQRYLHHFHVENHCVQIADFAHYDVQDLLRTSDLLITDYSSVYFDFAYMGKPIIYYQFDQEEYHKNHYAEGYFKFERDGFGPVCTSEEETVRRTREYIRDHFKVEDLYCKRAQRFFLYRDFHNCERIYDAIMRH